MPTIQILRDTEAKRKASTRKLLPGQPFYEVDTHKLFVGGVEDGTSLNLATPVKAEPLAHTHDNYVTKGTTGLQELMGSSPIGSDAQGIYWDGTKFVARTATIEEEITPWSDITRWAQQISDGEATPEQLGLKVGQTRTVTLSTGEELVFEIIGFNHDELADGSGKKAGITFCMKGLLNTQYKFGEKTYSATEGTLANDPENEKYRRTWSNSLIRTSVLPTIFEMLPQELQKEMKRVIKHSKVDVYRQNNASSVQEYRLENYALQPEYSKDLETVDRLFLLSSSEVYDKGTSDLYEYYRVSSPYRRVKYASTELGGLEQPWALRDVSNHHLTSFGSSPIDGNHTGAILTSMVGTDGLEVKETYDRGHEDLLSSLRVTNTFWISFAFCI